MSLLTTLHAGDSFFPLINRPSLELWLDAIASPIQRDGSNAVSRWEDISGNGNHAVQNGSDPMPEWIANKNGFPAIYSDGTTGQKLDFTHSVTENDPFTVLALFEGDSTISDPSKGSSLNVIFAFGGADLSDNSVALRQLRDDPINMSYVAYSNGSTLDGSPFGGAEIFSITYDGSNVAVHYGATEEPDSGAAASTRIFGNGRLFNEIPENTARTAIGWMRSILLFKEALSDADRNQIISALKQRYGIV
jgi:hypothetical protein